MNKRQQILESKRIHDRFKVATLILYQFLLKNAFKSSLPTFFLIAKLVPRAGLEPAHLAARDFKSLVSTYFTTWA